MKIALCIQDDIEQIVLTPENETETNIVRKLEEPRSITVCRGSFYQCRAGYSTHGLDDDSTFIVLRKVENK